MMHWMFGHGLWMATWWILGAVLAGAFIWALIRVAQMPRWSWRGPARPHPLANGPRDSPVDVLKRRYANGEIDQDSYQRMLKELAN